MKTLTKWTLKGTFEVREDEFIPRPIPIEKYERPEEETESYDWSMLLPFPKEMIIPDIKTDDWRHGEFYQFKKSFKCEITKELYEVAGEYTEGEYIRTPSIRENLLDTLEQALVKKVQEAQLKFL